jgi:GNAT superfamily N-acetyltransferase
MRSCSVIEKLQIVPGCLDDYKKLAHFHYRDSCPGPFAAIFAIKPAKALGARSVVRLRSPPIGTETVGVIVYTMPIAGAELRNIATGNLFVGLDKGTRLALINKNIRCISRVIIEPRFRGLGLASRLVRETMPKMDVPIVEAMAVMGLVNPFFEKAGMKAFTANMPTRCVQLVEAFSMVGVEKEELIDSEGVQGKLARLGQREAEFIELQIRHFLQSYGKRRYERAGLERTGFVLSKLTFRPVYYIWFNPKTAFSV